MNDKSLNLEKNTITKNENMENIDKKAFEIYCIGFITLTVILMGIILIQFIIPGELLSEAKTANPRLTKTYNTLSMTSVGLFSLFYIVRFLLYPLLMGFKCKKQNSQFSFNEISNVIYFPSTWKMKLFKAFYLVLAFSGVCLCIASQTILYAFI